MPMHPALQPHGLAPLLELLFEPDRQEAGLAALQRAGLLGASQLDDWRAALRGPAHASDNGDLIAQAKLLVDPQATRRGKLAPSEPLAVLAQLQPLLQWAQTRGFAGLTGARVLDLGAGLFYPLSASALLYANGAQQATAFEPWPIHAEFAASAVQSLVLAVMDDPARFALSGVDPATLAPRLAQLDLRHLARRLQDGEGRVDLGGVRLLRSLDDLASGSLDLLFSNSVLEHIDDLPDSLRRQHALLRSGGFACHTVDFADHRHYHDRRTHPLQCLADGVLDAINGLRPPQMERLFLAAGFQAFKQPKLAFPPGVFDPARPRHPRFAGLPETAFTEWVNGYLLCKS